MRTLRSTTKPWIVAALSSITLLVPACSSSRPQPSPPASPSQQGEPLPAGLPGVYRITYQGGVQYLEIRENSPFCSYNFASSNCYLRGEQLQASHLTGGRVKATEGEVVFEGEVSEVIQACREEGRCSYVVDTGSLMLTDIEDPCQGRRDLFVSGRWERQA